jgi:hypothetical protein
VPAAGIEVHLRGDTFDLQRLEVGDGIFDVDWVVFGLHEKCRWSAGGRLHGWIQVERAIGCREIRGIDQELKVGAATEAICGVDRRVVA